ncbi:MAG: ester cyclase [Acidobacteria bacterium]|nr:ester cyclase [Acidobacteriota bacterium]
MTATLETLVRRFYDDLWNRFDTTLVPVLLTEDVTLRGALGRHAAGHAAFADYLELVRGAFPDFEQTIDEVVVDDVGGSAFVRLRCRGTHRGALFGLPATGQRITYEGAARFETRDGRIADIWLLGDVHGLLRQLRAEREQPER